MDDLLRQASLVPALIAATVIAAGVLHAAAGRPHAAAGRFAVALALALEFLLAAGLLRLSTLDLPALGIVAAVIVVRQILARGVQSARSAAA